MNQSKRPFCFVEECKQKQSHSTARIPKPSRRNGFQRELKIQKKDKKSSNQQRLNTIENAVTQQKQYQHHSLRSKMSDPWDEITNADPNKSCLMSRKLSTFRNGVRGDTPALQSVLSFFQSACDSQEFYDKCETLGLREGAFVANELLRTGHPSYDKFRKALLNTRHDVNIGLVFHGTQEQNVDAICTRGLDPNKRSGQAYGPGVSNYLAWLGFDFKCAPSYFYVCHLHFNRSISPRTLRFRLVIAKEAAKCSFFW